MNKNIVNITYKNKQIFLIKTAHVSKNSIEDVKEAIDEINPDSICVELDKARYDSIINNDKWKNANISKVIKEGKVWILLVNIILSNFQKRMAISLESKSGGEMMEAIKIANEKNINLVLADRSINATFSRVWNSLGIIEKSKLIVTIITAIFDKEEIKEEELEELKTENSLDHTINEISKEFPNLKKTLVDERDMYLCQKIKTASGNKIVAIIGAAHSIGIKNYLNEEIDTDQLERIEKKKHFSNVLKWIIPLLIILLILFTIIKNKDAGIEQIKTWILWNGTAAALGSLICLAHPLTILVSFLAAPITSLNPLLSVGLFASLTEAKFRNPKVKDFENITNDTNNIKGFFKNQVTKILLIFIMANLFSSLATFISGAGIIKIFLNIK